MADALPKTKRRKSKSKFTTAKAGSSSRTAFKFPEKWATSPSHAHLVSHHAATTTELQELVRPHVDSFNYILESDEGLALAVQNLEAQIVEGDETTGRPTVRFWLDKVRVLFPSKATGGTDSRLLPSECRERALTYSAQLVGTITRQVGDGDPVQIERTLGQLPIMVRSARCHLRHMSRSELADHKEEASEWGGYFILNGLERLMRLLIVPRRNHVFCLNRGSFTNRGQSYSSLATQIRCVRSDQTSRTVTVHYLTDGTCRVRFTYRKQEHFLPAVLVLKALCETTDREIYESIVQGDLSNAFLSDRVEVMLREARKTGVHRRSDVLSLLGRYYRHALRVPESDSDEMVGEILLKRTLFIHIDKKSDESNNRDKFNLLIYMMRKLYALANDRIQPDNPDALSCQELLLPGHLYLMLLAEKLDDYLAAVRSVIMRDIRLKPAKVDFSNDTYFKKVLGYAGDVGKKIAHFLTTGNLVSQTGLDLMQTSGFTIVAEKLNYFRYMSHFRSVHRGQFFTEMKTTSVRKLLPESWGFMCPVHTPDGSPCGLLNHLSRSCRVLTHPCKVAHQRIVKILLDLGVVPIAQTANYASTYLDVMVDGIVVGKIEPGLTKGVAAQLRLLKISPDSAIPSHLEVCLVPVDNGRAFPGLYLATTPARMVRPVRNLVALAAARRARAAAGGSAGSAKTGLEDTAVEWVGALEQVHMDIAVVPKEYVNGCTTHMELDPTNMLSIIASLTPFSDFNQSPRNMYQCQMGKQTMGMPFHSFPYRLDNKVYRIQTPQTPMVRNAAFDRYMNDEYPLGTNAVVAVISYTGYDMEDAMILNKAAVERGFAHGSVYKGYRVDLSQQTTDKTKRFTNSVQFKNKQGITRTRTVKPELDSDGLPRVADKLQKGAALYNVVDTVTNKAMTKKMKESEPAVIEDIRVLGTSADQLQQVGIKLRINRNPVIGDKFSSRHGQKGVLSRLWPQEDMPFSESGMSPDLIINPHAFPSRMTIGMLIESMAGKAAALHGVFQDATPFRFSDEPGNRAVDYFGEQLVQAGYNYSGNETLYSGITGEEFQVEIFIGVVYYQRLRHMVSDKSQVRATGPVDHLTRQPVQGRKKGGGIRFGEMERDSLIAHGAAYLLHDRLMTCSDYHTAPVCAKCGSMLSVYTVGRLNDSQETEATGRTFCRNCQDTEHVTSIAVPYVFTYLVNELAAMNIRLSLDIKSAS